MKPSSQLDNECNTAELCNSHNMSLLALLGAYNSILGSSHIPLLAFAIRLVLLIVIKLLQAMLCNLRQGQLILVFCAPMCCRIYVQPKGLRMSRQMQSNERGAGMRSIFTGQQLSVHQALSCACIDITSECRSGNGLRIIMHHRLMFFDALFPVHISNRMYQHMKQ